MPLPKISSPLFDLSIPSKNTSVRARPFVVREEKILLLAGQSNSEREALLAIKQVVNNCVEDATFDINDLTIFDLEYMFVALRARSINNIVEINVTDREDGQVYPIRIDLDDVKLEVPEEVTKDINVNEDVILRLAFPKISAFENIPEGANSEDVLEVLVHNMLDCVFVGDEVTHFKDQPKQEIEEFLESLSVSAYKEITAFADSIPAVSYSTSYKNSKGSTQYVGLRGLQDFFT